MKKPLFTPEQEARQKQYLEADATFFEPNNDGDDRSRVHYYELRVCRTCGALVSERDIETHFQWHQRLDHLCPVTPKEGDTPR